MNRTLTINYEKKGKENLNRTLVRRRYGKAIIEAIKEHKGGSVILLETPVENYLDVNLSSVQSLLRNGFEGVYLSFQRPFNNISKLFEQQNIDINKLCIIDGATMITGEINKNNSRCVQLSKDSGIDDITNTICLSLPRLKSKNRFVFVDSLTTMALYESRSKVFRLPEYLLNSIREKEIKNVVFIFNVAQDLIKGKDFDRLTFYSDEHIHLGLCT